MIDVQFSITGSAELDRKLSTLPTRVQKKVLRPGVRAGAKVMQTAAKAAVPVLSGVYRQSLKVRAAKRSRKNPNAVRVNVVTGESLFRGKGFYGAFLEYGWKAGSRKTYSVGPGGEPRHKLGRLWLKQRIPVEGKHYLKNAFDSAKATAAAAAKAVIRDGIMREASASA